MASKSKLVLIENRTARAVDAHVLPKLIEDARDDADALAALVEIAFDLASIEALHATGAALARLRALESPRAAELSAQAGIALIAARDIDANAGLAGVPVRAPLWTDMIAGASSFLPAASSTAARTKQPAQVALFAFSDESSSSVPASAGPTTLGGLLTRAIPLAIAERLLAYADCVVTTPVVESKGFYVAKRAWELPEVLALSPLAEANPGYVVTGRVKRIDPFAIEIDVWDLAEGVLKTRSTEVGDDHAVVVALTATIADVASGRKRTAKKRLPPRALREVRDDIVPARETRAHLEALAHLHAMLLAAAGVIDVREMVNVDVALSAMRELAKDDESLRVQLGLAAFIVVCIAGGVKLDERARNEARDITNALSDRLRTSASD